MATKESKMSDMKCPFCQQELERVLQLAGAGGLIEEAYLLCSKCNIRGERKLWQELITTRKALDVAVDALKIIGSGEIIEHSVLFHEDDNKIMIANKAIEQINEIKGDKR